jgi:baseplate J-like protein
MTRVLDREALRERARDLGGSNGFKQVFVTLDTGATPPRALLEIEFHNGNHLTPLPAAAEFRITGGSRIRAGDTPSQVHVAGVTGASVTTLTLQVTPIGDYSTYTLHWLWADADPLFASIPFKFRPGCFNLNCAPDWDPAEPARDEPAIDYLAKDYDSFRHVLITAIMQRVPGWAATSEADFDQVLIDLIAADADELSDYQDRVMNEAYLLAARKRVSLARHARLVDYHVHQGNQATTWLAVRVASDLTLPREFGVWTDETWSAPGATIFATTREKRCFASLNELTPYAWDGSVTAIEAGSTEADLVLSPPMTQADAIAVRDLLLDPAVEYLLIQEALNPDTGTVNGRDIGARQLLRLVPLGSTPPRAEAAYDPVGNSWLVRVRWQQANALTRRYCLVTHCTGQPPVTGITLFFGNVVEASHGRPHVTTFRAPGADLGPGDDHPFVSLDEAHYKRTDWGALCRLTHAPLAYRNTAPGGEVAPRTTLEVRVSGFADLWAEQTDLIESQGDDEHFLVETDEFAGSTLRFGTGVNGAQLPEDAIVTCSYRVSQGTAGNAGSDTLTGFDRVAFPLVQAVWNPLDVTNGRDPEPVAEIVRRAPEAYRARQLRAVTLDDYRRRAEEVPGVAHARARYGWTGSWRTVRVAIDPEGTTVLDPFLRERIARHLEAVRLIGEDLEIRTALYVPLDIHLRLCAHPQYWPEDLRIELEMEFSEGHTTDGRQGFFHPDLWTFGQPLYASQIIGRALAVEGVERVLRLSLRRWNPGAGGALTTIVVDPADIPQPVAPKLEVGAFEIIRVANDPDHLEHGRILFEILGGRR